MSRKSRPSGELLRKMAEAKFSAAEVDLSAVMSRDETWKLMHELKVHQIELEMQNEELLRSETELEAAWARYFDLYDMAPAGYLTVNEKGVVLEANLTLAGYLGVTKGALKDKVFAASLSSEGADTWHLFQKKLFETCEPQSCELRLLRAHDHPFWARINATFAIDAQNTPVCRAVVVDISERVKKDQRLLELTAEWERTFDAVEDLIFVQDKDMNIVKVNKSCAKALKMAPRDIIGKKCYDIVHHSDHPWLNCPFVEAKLDRVPRMEEVSDPHLGIYLLVTVSPLFSTDGEFIGGVHIAKDITDLKKAEAAKLAQLRELEIFKKASLGREERILELKDEVRALKAELSGLKEGA